MPYQVSFNCRIAMPTLTFPLLPELNYLPGGFHACCLSTLMDTTEPSIVRENAAYTFSTLISYRAATGELNERVEPRSSADVDNDSPKANHLDLLIKEHKLYVQIVASLEHFHAGESIRSEHIFYETNSKLTSCDLVRAFCTILSNLLAIRTLSSIDMIGLTMLKIIKLVAHTIRGKQSIGFD